MLRQQICKAVIGCGLQFLNWTVNADELLKPFSADQVLTMFDADDPSVALLWQTNLGRRVSPAWIAAALAADAPALTPEDAFAALIDGRTILDLADGLQLRRARVIGAPAS
jgi:hypothetical protein